MPLVDRSQSLGVEVAVHRVEGAGQIHRALVERVGRLLHLRKHLALGRRQLLHQLLDRHPVISHLLDRLEMGAELLAGGTGKLPRQAHALDQLGLHRVRRWRTGEHVAPVVPGLPEPGVVAQQADPHAEGGEEEPGMVDPGRDVDPHAAERHRGPARELPADLLHDLGLAGVGQLVGIPRRGRTPWQRTRGGAAPPGELAAPRRLASVSPAAASETRPPGRRAAGLRPVGSRRASRGPVG